MCDDIDNYISPVNYFFSGTFGGVLAILTTHPIDTIKTRIQIMPHPQPGQKPMYTGATDAFKKTLRKEGVFGLYKGMGPVLWSSPILVGLSFCGYGIGKKIQQTTECEELKIRQIFLAGVCSALFTVTCSVPVERIKSILQMQQTRPKSPIGYGKIEGELPKFSGPVDVVRRLYNSRGLRSLYLGLFVTLLRDMPAAGAGYASYEACKRYFTSHDGSIHLGWTLVSGVMAGIGFWIVALPIDLLKTKYQTSKFGTYEFGIRSVFREVYDLHGVRGFFIGAKPIFLRAVIANPVTFVGFEVMNRLLRELEESIVKWLEPR